MDHLNIKVIDILKKAYPDSKCSLNFQTPFELLIAVMLSAQCTDERVNKITPLIFKSYSTPQDFVDIPLEKLEKLIHSCGFFKTKAKNIKLLSKRILQDFNGEVPKNMEDLMSLPGIGRKSANVVMLEAFGIPSGIAIDTHAKRIANRIGFSESLDPLKIENDLIRIFPKKYIKDINHLLIWHGRNCCTARNPKCDKCPISSFCKTYKYKFS